LSQGFGIRSRAWVRVDMAGKSSKKKEKADRNSGGPWFALKAAGGVAAFVALLAAVGAGQWFKKAGKDAAELEHLKLLGNKAELQNKLQTMMQEMQSVEDKRREAEKEKAAVEAAGSGLGPGVMAAQAKLISRLLELVQQVDALKNEGQREERVAVSRRVEEELVELEAESQQQAGTAIGKQQAGLIALVRSALRQDRDGDAPFDEAEWTDEALRQKHGLVTYASPAYWDDAYNGGRYGGSFDWYGAWEEQDLNGKALKDVVRPLLAPDARILILGCGNSNMSALMHKEGHKPIVSVDISEAVIEQMKERHGQSDTLDWRAMDAAAMDFPDAAFDVAVEKGMFDALYAGSGERVQTALNEVLRVLRPGGRLISVSFGADRISRLFAPLADGNDKLSCHTAGEMSYPKGAVNTTLESGEDKAIYVYSCDHAAPTVA